MVAFSYNYGFFLPIIEEADVPLASLKEAGFSRAFVDLYEQCRKQKVTLLRIDRDGPYVIGLPKFDW